MTTAQLIGRGAVAAVMVLSAWIPLEWSVLAIVASVAAAAGGAVGLWLGAVRGARAEAARWRFKGDTRFADALIESEGRKYWVCGLDAPREMRVFVAAMLTAEAPMGKGQVSP